MKVSRTGRPYPSFFLLGGSSDFNAGGYTLVEIAKNLKLCIEEKERKVAPYRSKYPEWRLVLPDHIGYSLDAELRREFREQITMDHTWDKLVLVDRQDHQRAFEIEAKRQVELNQPQNQSDPSPLPYTSRFGYYPKLPEDIREVFMWLCQDVAALREKWDFYQELFDKGNIDLLSELARASFQIFEESLRDDLTMSICRLSDPAKSLVARKRTICRLPIS